jgi:flagellar basal-body rod protein FlgF
MRQLDVVANNLANSTTTGFKAQQSLFESVLQSTFSGDDGRLLSGAPARSFVASLPEQSDFRVGAARHTGSPLDVAIEGDGFFEIETPNGLRYTRAGQFALSPQGQLSTMDGHAVMGEGGPITATPGATIGPDGSVLDVRGESIGKLKLVAFDDPNKLQRIGANLYAPADDTQPAPVEQPRLLPAALEQSNVDSVSAMAQLVLLQRAFQINLEALRADDAATESLIRRFSE